MAKIYLGLGGNIGDVKAHILEAMAYLEDNFPISLIALSSPYQTPPWGEENQDWFINACSILETKLDPEKILSACQQVEKLLKRERKIKWGPRTLDIDLLAIEDIDEYHSQRLTLPHPYMLERAFVLYPLAEIAPNLEIKGKTIAYWAQHMCEEKIKKLPSSPQWKNFQKKHNPTKTQSL